MFNKFGGNWIMNNPNNRAPKKVFISYSWSSEEKYAKL